MAVTFGCPLVGTYDELCGKHLKVGQRAYATDGQSEVYVHEGTNWKTGAVDENGNLIVYERLPWDTNMGGDNEVNPSNYYTKEEIDAKIFTLACELKENSEVYGGIEPINLSATYAEVYAAYIEGKTIKVIGKFLDRADTLILDLVGFTNNTFNFSGILSNISLSLYLNDTNVEVSASDLQLKNNMLTKIEGSENVDNCYPSVKAVADYVAKYTVNELELEKLQYYGDKNIEITDESYFKFNENGEVSFDILVESITDTLIIPYKKENIFAKKITSVGDLKCKKIIIPNCITTIGDRAFQTCFNLQKITIPSSVTTIGAESFIACPSLSKVVITEGVTAIGSNAFSFCPKLSKVFIPDSVVTISTNVFRDCNNLTIICNPGSAAEDYAKENNIKYAYEYIDPTIIGSLLDRIIALEAKLAE